MAPPHLTRKCFPAILLDEGWWTPRCMKKAKEGHHAQIVDRTPRTRRCCGGGIIYQSVHSHSSSGPVDTVTTVTAKPCVQPPANLNPDTLPPAQIQEYGLPPKPKNPAAVPTWRYVVTHIKQRGCTFLKHSLPVTRQPASRKIQPNASASGYISNTFAGNDDIQRYYNEVYGKVTLANASAPDNSEYSAWTGFRW
jgi:hypothetical protein